MRAIKIFFIFLFALLFAPISNSAAEPPPNGPTMFSNRTAEAGITATHTSAYFGIGQAWGDINNDGWPDLYLTDNLGPNSLYENNGDGTFSLSQYANDVSLPNAISGGAVFADYDNDGWADLYVLNQGPNVLYHNQAGQGFMNVTAVAGVGDPWKGETAAWGDYDKDGYLDLYVTNWICAMPECPTAPEGNLDKLYHNNGDGTFSDVTDILHGFGYGAGFVASFVDFDNDNDLDIYLVNDKGSVFPPTPELPVRRNVLWRNDGPTGCGFAHCFTEVALALQADARVFGMGLAVGDYDNDGDLDFYFSNAGPMTLLQNQGPDAMFPYSFSDVASTAGVQVSQSAIGWGTVFSDFNNDGWLDLYLAIMAGENPVFINNGDGTFTDLGNTSGADNDADTLGVAYSDYDKDGRIDLIIGNLGQDFTLYHNDDPSGNRGLTIDLVGGSPINLDAIGARVYLETSDGKSQMQEVKSGSSLGAGNDMALHFGLGQAEVSSLTVRWPDGTTAEFDTFPTAPRWRIQYPGTMAVWSTYLPAVANQ